MAPIQVFSVKLWHPPLRVLRRTLIPRVLLPRRQFQHFGQQRLVRDLPQQVGDAVQAGAFFVVGVYYTFRMNGLADPFWANFERFLVVLWPPFEKGVRSDLIRIVCKDTATFSENLIKFVQRLEVFIDDGLVGQRP